MAGEPKLQSLLKRINQAFVDVLTYNNKMRTVDEIDQWKADVIARLDRIEQRLADIEKGR